VFQTKIVNQLNYALFIKIIIITMTAIVLT